MTSWLSSLITASSCLGQCAETHHVPDVVRNGNAPANGHLPGNQVLQLDMTRFGRFVIAKESTLGTLCLLQVA
jgi:hypothetical protein